MGPGTNISRNQGAPTQQSSGSSAIGTSNMNRSTSTLDGLGATDAAMRSPSDSTKVCGINGTQAAKGKKCPEYNRNRIQDVSTSDVNEQNPLWDLEKPDNIEVNEPLEYPLGLQSDNRFAHAMKISIFKPAKSTYNIDEVSSVLSSDTAASRNRANFGQNIVRQGLGGIGADGDFINETVIGGLVGVQTGVNAYSAGVRAGALTAAPTALLAGTQATGIAGALTYVLEKNINLDRKAKKLAQNIYLYTPQQVIFTQQHKYSEQSATAALGALGYVAQGGQSLSAATSFSAVIQKLGTLAEGPFGQELKNLVVGNAARTLGIIGEGAQDFMLQSQGYAQNPQMEVLFDTTDFRQFTFEFDFMPRSSDESDQVMNITKALRFYSAPELFRAEGGGGSRYFVPPYYFEIEFMLKLDTGEFDINPKIPKITTCVLEQVDIDYVGESDRFVSHADGVPVHMKMTLRFKEIEIIHKELVRQGY